MELGVGRQERKQIAKHLLSQELCLGKLSANGWPGVFLLHQSSSCRSDPGGSRGSEDEAGRGEACLLVERPSEKALLSMSHVQCHSSGIVTWVLGPSERTL